MASRTHQQDIQHDYEALLIYSSSDEDLANALWGRLKTKGLNITQHKDPDGPFRIGTLAYYNMIHAIERSEKMLVLFTQAAVNSGFVSLEMMLAIEKSRRTRHMGLYLIAVGLQDNDVCALKHGLLGYVPHISVDTNRENWEDSLLTKLKEPRESMDNLLPAGNLAHGQVFSHYVGYLQYVLPAFQDKIKECDFYKENPGRVCMKYLMLIPESCNTENHIEGVYPTADDSEIKIEHVDNLLIQKAHGEKNREFKPTIYKATKRGERQPIYFIAEFQKSLYSVYQLKHKGIADVDTRLEANRFYYTMNNLVNHRLKPGCNDKAVLLRFADTKVSDVGEVLWNASNAEIQSGQQDISSANQDLSYFHQLRDDAQQNYAYDATVTCLSPASADRAVANNIAEHLEISGKTVNRRDVDSGHLAELNTARWNIFVMSQHSFDGEVVSIGFISAIQRCAVDKCIHILPIISGITMDQVPDAFKAMTMISTEQDKYLEIILAQVEGKMVHMYQKMPAGDVSTGLGWAYLLNYLPIQLGATTEDGLDFYGRIKKHLRDQKEDCGCLPFFYVVLSSTGEVVKPDISGGPIEDFGRVEPPIRQHQAGAKDREYYIKMYKINLPGAQKEICSIIEALTPGIALNTMAKELPFAGIEPGKILKDQIQNLGDLINGRIHDHHYKATKGDFTKLFRLIRYDMDKGESLSDVITRQLETDLNQQTLIYAAN